MTDIVIIGALFLGVLLLLYAVGVPVAIAMGATSVMVMFSPFGPDFNHAIVTNQLFHGLNSFSLIALPFYLFLGRIMNRSGLTELIFDFANAIISQIRGGIAFVNVVASIIFSGMSGLAVADAAGLGRVEYAAMRDAGYDKDLSLGVTGSSAIIGPIIPPSVPLIIYGVLAEESVGALFLAGIIPGLLLAIVLMSFLYILVRIRGYERGPAFDLRESIHAFVAALPAMAIPLIIVLGILFGVFTATEAGAVAVVYSVMLAGYYGDLQFRGVIQELRDSMIETFSLTFIVAMAAVYGLVAIELRLPILIAEAITGFTTDPTLIMLLFVALFLLVGSFMSVTPSLIILVPIIIPITGQIGIDPIHLGVVMVLTLSFGLITPPLGIILFVLEKVTDASFEQAIKGVLPFYVPMLIAIIAIALFPELVTYIPYELAG